ncbi:hypothetical protein HDV01_005167 [Terramyces sp. JEL0728]|nr:hypothetical protein HDV01_005167 [Terramyces sp. JEL0728]
MSENYYQDHQHYNTSTYSPHISHDNTSHSPFLKAAPYGSEIIYGGHNSPGNLNISQLPYVMSPTVTPQFAYRPQEQPVYNEQGTLPPALSQSDYNSHVMEQINGQTEYNQKEYLNEPSSGVTPAQLLELTFRDDNNHTPTYTPVQETRSLVQNSLPIRRQSSESSKPPSNAKIKKMSNKEAEQMRRDKLKDAFKAVKVVLPFEKEKHPSKVLILKRAREQILDLEHDNVQKDLEIQHLKSQIEHLKAAITSRGLSVPYFRPYTRVERHSGENYISSEDEDD